MPTWVMCKKVVMDKRGNNPFSPGAGRPPPELAGRDEILKQVAVAQGLLSNGNVGQSFLVHGLRGVGKTVLLGQMYQEAVAQGGKGILVEAGGRRQLAAKLANNFRKILFAKDGLASTGKKLRRAFAVLASFANTFKLEIGGVGLGCNIEPEKGMADTGNLEHDLPDLFEAMAAAAQERNKAITIFIDEAQSVERVEFSAIIQSLHRMQQLQLPLLLVGAGLPALVKLASTAESYAERLFNLIEVGKLAPADAKEAIEKPAAKNGVRFHADAVQEIVRVTQGYPYFLQLWGSVLWERGTEPEVTLGAVREAESAIIKQLDESFFRFRYEKLPPSQQKFLRAMAELGTTPASIAEVAQLLGKKTGGVSAVREKLIAKGLVYPVAHGILDYSVPLFDEYLRRQVPEFKPQ